MCRLARVEQNKLTIVAGQAFPSQQILLFLIGTIKSAKACPKDTHASGSHLMLIDGYPCCEAVLQLIHCTCVIMQVLISKQYVQSAVQQDLLGHTLDDISACAFQ